MSGAVQLGRIQGIQTTPPAPQGRTVDSGGSDPLVVPARVAGALRQDVVQDALLLLPEVDADHAEMAAESSHRPAAAHAGWPGSRAQEARPQTAQHSAERRRTSGRCAASQRPLCGVSELGSFGSGEAIVYCLGQTSSGRLMSDSTI